MKCPSFGFLPGTPSLRARSAFPCSISACSGWFAAASLLLLAAHTSTAAILTAVPMQGGMVMPMVSYRAAENRMHVTLPEETPQLTPLLISHPGDGFDPADPWFDALDPSRRGAAFSRRYGFVMDPDSDPLPAGTQIWIRKLSGSPDLKFYRYSASLPKRFEPIFGTDDSSPALYWNALMFHPVVTAPPATNDLVATFELYLFDTATGTELEGTASGVLALDWTCVSDGRPFLACGPEGVVRWNSNTATNWILESSASLEAPAAWKAVTNMPQVVNGECRVTTDRSQAMEFFRMRYVP